MGYISLEPGGSRPPTSLQSVWARDSLNLTARPIYLPAASWLDDYVLEDGQLGLEIDTNRFKIGNGTGSWDELAYATPAPGDLVDAHYIHDQAIASDTWAVVHNLGKWPAVQIYDSSGASVIGSITFLSLNSLTVEFSAAIGGKAVCN